MSGKHRAARKHGSRAALAITAAGLLLATTSGVSVAAVGTTSPAPRDCTDAVAALIAARVTEKDTHDALVALQADVLVKLKVLQDSASDRDTAKRKAEALQADRDNTAAALAAFDQAHPDKTKLTDVEKAQRGKLVDSAAAAQTAYDDPKTGYEAQRARQTAAADRNTAGFGPWQLASNKERGLRERDQNENRVIVELQLLVGKLCDGAPPPPDIPPSAQRPPVAEAPTTVEAHLPVTH
jgi:hypothetical protein